MRIQLCKDCEHCNNTKMETGNYKHRVWHWATLSWDLEESAYTSCSPLPHAQWTCKAMNGIYLLTGEERPWLCCKRTAFTCKLFKKIGGE